MAVGTLGGHQRILLKGEDHWGVVWQRVMYGTRVALNNLQALIINVLTQERLDHGVLERGIANNDRGTRMRCPMQE